MPASPSAQPILQLRNIRARYGPIEVLHGIDLDVPAGRVTAILGRNGSGKTTLLRVMAALQRPTGGDLILAGRNVNGVDPVSLARLGVCTIPEGRGVFPNLTVKENLMMVTYRGVSRRAVEERAFTYFPRLRERHHQLAGSLSGGEQQMLALARGISSEPTVLLLDELSMGLAPKVVEALYDAIRCIAATGTTIVMVEQFAAAVMTIADNAALISQGRVVATGAPRDLETRLSSVYLGEPTPTGSANCPAIEGLLPITTLLDEADHFSRRGVDRGLVRLMSDGGGTAEFGSPLASDLRRDP